MRKRIRSMAAFYLGASLSVFANVNFLQWQFWAIVVPVVILFGISDDE